MIQLLIADDHKMFMDGLTSILGDEDDIEIIGQAVNGHEVMEKLQTLTPDVILLDINMPEMDGIETSEWIIKNKPSTKILIISMFHKTVMIEKLIKIGVQGYILKNASHKELLNAIRNIYNGETFFGETIKNKLIEKLQREEKGEAELTTREIEILQLMAEGLSTPEIANKLFISTHTVETHRKNLMNKTEVHNTIKLINWGIEKGYILVE